jgi:hypothetical protein
VKKHRPQALAVVLTAVVGAAVAGALASRPATATTGAAYTIDVPVQVRGTILTVKKNEFTKKGIVRYPRGTTVHFHIRNATKKTIRPQLRVITGLNFYGGSKFSKITKSPKAIAPGKTGAFDVYFFFRGKLSFEAVTAGKVVASAPVGVF